MFKYRCKCASGGAEYSRLFLPNMIQLYGTGAEGCNRGKYPTVQGCTAVYSTVGLQLYCKFGTVQEGTVKQSSTNGNDRNVIILIQLSHGRVTSACVNSFAVASLDPVLHSIYQHLAKFLWRCVHANTQQMISRYPPHSISNKP